MNLPPTPEAFVKVTMLGESGVGKTSLVSRFRGYSWEETYSSAASTIGADFYQDTTEVEFDNRAPIAVAIHVTDTAGQERFAAVTRSYVRGKQVLVLVFDLTNRLSWEKINTRWLPMLMQESDLWEQIQEKKVAVAVVGNKLDQIVEEAGDRRLIKERKVVIPCSRLRCVDIRQVKQWCHTYGFVYYESSARDRGNDLLKVVEQCITRLDASVILDQLEKKTSVVRLTEKKEENGMMMPRRRHQCC